VVSGASARSSAARSAWQATAATASTSCSTTSARRACTALAERTYLNPGTLARSLLSRALDQADPDPATVTSLLDSIPGAWERAQAGLADISAGRMVSPDEL
jgi:hypothetical protein